MGLTTVQRYCAACDIVECFVLSASSVDNNFGATKMYTVYSKLPRERRNIFLRQKKS